MQNPADDLDALAAKHPDHALEIRTLKAQLAAAEHSPDSVALRRVIMASIERLAAKLKA